MRSLLIVAGIFCFLKLGFCQSTTNAPLSCWVGYAPDATTLRGGSLPCDGTCVYVKGVYSGQNVNLFACEPSGECDTLSNIAGASGLNLTVTCCDDSPNCNAANNGFNVPPPTTPVPPLHPPIVCNAGLYYKNMPLAAAGPKLCYGECASVTLTTDMSSNETFTLATCDPLALCKNLNLINSCHTMPQSILSGCCCDSNLCIDPATNKKPMPPPPPPGSIKCFIGVSVNGNMTGAETYCSGMCHNTNLTISGNTYTVYACDHFNTLCGMLGIAPNTCGNAAGTLSGCCCDSDYCNTPTNFTAPAIDPYPPLQAERCFTGISLNSLGNNPVGRVAECFGDCVKYSAVGVTIYGCDPISVCEAFGAKDQTANFGNLSVTCCSTPECTYQPSRTQINCMNGITISSPEHNFTYSKGQSLPCIGQCARYSTSLNHIDVDVYTCDPYNLCNFNLSSGLYVDCCNNGTDCNVDPNIPVNKVNGTGSNIMCFEGFAFKQGRAFGNRINCDGVCARVHIGDNTIYTCDPSDACTTFGLDGCHILADGLSVCCCNGSGCNEPERRIQPAIKDNLQCFIGYGVGTAVSGASLPCKGMCGKLSTVLGNATVDAYLCLDLPICENHALYEQCSNLAIDQAVRGCCCGGYNHCNYEPVNGIVPTVAPTNNSITCPQGLFVNGMSVYGTGNIIVTCPNSCGGIHFNSSYQGTNVSFTYYGCDPAAFCDSFGLSNSCGTLGNTVGACCCDSNMCMNPIGGHYIPSGTLPPPKSQLNCWVGYNYNGTLRGGSMRCDGGTCLHVTGSYSNQTVDLFACEPYGLCSTNMSLAGFNAYCCDDADNCNAVNYTIPTQPTPTPSMSPPILCYEGLYMNNSTISGGSAKMCYGECASVSIALNSTTLTVATCDPVTLCKNLDLVNSCHTMPQNILSGCCCGSNLCIDPSTNKKPMPPPPPPGSIKCFIGVSVNGNMTGAETYCPGMCHNTNLVINKNNYTIYACDQFDVLCRMLGIAPNACGNEAGTINGCCCDYDYCNTPTNFTAPPIDPNPPLQAERCFTGLSLASLGGNPLGRVTECFGDCVTYSAAGVTIYGCDPISVCEALGAKDGSATDGDLNVTCCSTPECTYRPSRNLMNCLNGITINSPAYNFAYSKGQSLPCLGQCARYSTSLKSISVNVYTCDPYNACNFNLSGVLSVNCCNSSDNCNVDPNVNVTLVNGSGKNISCFEGFSLRQGQAFGNHINCDGSCARVHIGDNTIYTCDPADTCNAFGLDGCHILFDGFTVCCCNGSRCNDPERRIPPALKDNLQCFIGYGVGTTVSGASLACNGMCGKLTTTLGSATVDAYLCLDRPICENHALYEQCSNLAIDQAVRGCCCGGYNHCNYEPVNGIVPTVAPTNNSITCPQGLFVNGMSVYGTGNIIVTCPNSCGGIHFNSSYQGTNVSFTYYGCDPAAFCDSFGLSNSCGTLGNTVGACCCDSNMCMNPIGGHYIPSGTLPPPKSQLNCWVGYNYNGTLRGGSMRCDGGTCLHVTGSYSNQTVDLFACEPYGLCSTNMSLAGFNAYCCDDADNCNAVNYTIPIQPTPTPSMSPPILCYEGLYKNNSTISGGSAKMCYGECASVSVALNANTTFTVATCDPVTLCQNLNLSNSCHTMPQNILSGCCCNSNLCLDPTTNLIPSPTPPPPNNKLNCWVGYNYNNTLRGGSMPCNGGTCLHVTGSYSNQTVDLFACEPYGLCSTNMSLAGFNAYCCDDADNCNAVNYTIPTQPTPTPSMSPPILCYEGLYMNNSTISGGSAKMCYGECASVSVALNSTTLTVATCDPVTLCQNLNLSNSCHTMPQNILSGCCCNSNLCLDPTTNLIPSPTPPPPNNKLNCWVGYNYNDTLRGGSVPCSAGTCLHVTGSYSNQDVDLFACEPYGLCSTNMSLAGFTATCCDDSDNCNANDYTIPDQPTPTPSMSPPILCYEGLYMNNSTISGGSAKKCYGECASVSVALNSTTLTVATCDPVSLCQNLNLTNSCQTMPQNILSGCCCNTNVCLDPTTNILPSTTSAPPTPTTSGGFAVAKTVSAILCIALLSLFY